MNANECFNSEDSESKSRTGSTGPPKSLRVCDTLSNCKILCFSSGKSILSRDSVNWVRAAAVYGHSQITCTSSSWNVVSHLLHSWFSRVTDRVHSRAITNMVSLCMELLHTVYTIEGSMVGCSIRKNI